jgi:hypothetical protein
VETTILPFADEASNWLLGVIPGSQAVALLRDGRPVAVVLDIDSYEEAEQAVGTGDYDVRPCQVPAPLNR